MRDPSQDIHKKSLGKSGEKRAANFLKAAGYAIVGTNYRTPFGEADIVAKSEGTYVLCEVKTRESEAFGTPAEAVGKDKQRRYRQIARWLQMRAGEEVNVRFDVLEVYGDRIVHLENAFGMR